MLGMISCWRVRMAKDKSISIIWLRRHIRRGVSTQEGSFCGSAHDKGLRFR